MKIIYKREGRFRCDLENSVELCFSQDFHFLEGVATAGALSFRGQGGIFSTPTAVLHCSEVESLPSTKTAIFGEHCCTY